MTLRLLRVEPSPRPVVAQGKARTVAIRASSTSIVHLRFNPPQPEVDVAPGERVTIALPKGASIWASAQRPTSVLVSEED
jgi:cytochrome c oxidase assembly protein Cox11